MLTRPLRIVVASADGDMAALLGQHVAWLVLVPRPSPSRPAPWRLQTAVSFQNEHGLPAHALSDYHALIGAPFRWAYVGSMILQCVHGHRPSVRILQKPRQGLLCALMLSPWTRRQTRRWGEGAWYRRGLRQEAAEQVRQHPGGAASGRAGRAGRLDPRRPRPAIRSSEQEAQRKPLGNHAEDRGGQLACKRLSNDQQPAGRSQGAVAGHKYRATRQRAAVADAMDNAVACCGSEACVACAILAHALEVGGKCSGRAGRYADGARTALLRAIRVSGGAASRRCGVYC